jgi:hypothetical protein
MIAHDSAVATNGRISAMPDDVPPDDVAEARQSVERAIAQLDVLRRRAAALRAEADQLDRQVAELTAELLGAAGTAPKPARRPAKEKPPPDPDRLAVPLPDGTGTEVVEAMPGGWAVRELEPVVSHSEILAAQADDVERCMPENPSAVEELADLLGATIQQRLRDTTIRYVLESIEGNTLEHILDACLRLDIETLGDLADAVTEVRGTSDEGIVSGMESHIFWQQVRLFFQRAGYSGSDLTADGLPKAWLRDAAFTDEKPAKHEATRDEELIRALHSFQGSQDRWKKLKQEGADDAQLKEAIGREFGTSGGSYGPGREGIDMRGGTDPAVWFGFRSDRKPDLRGKALVDRVRELMGVPKPPTVLGPAAPRSVGRPKLPAKGRKDQSEVESLLEGCLCPSDPHWKVSQKSGADGAALMREIDNMFRKRLSSSGLGWSVAVATGRTGPRFWASNSGARSKRRADLEGAALLEAGRKILGIGEPKKGGA